MRFNKVVNLTLNLLGACGVESLLNKLNIKHTNPNDDNENTYLIKAGELLEKEDTQKLLIELIKALEPSSFDDMIDNFEYYSSEFHEYN